MGARAAAVVSEDPHARADWFLVRLIVALGVLALLAIVFTGVAQ